MKIGTPGVIVSKLFVSHVLLFISERTTCASKTVGRHNGPLFHSSAARSRAGRAGWVWEALYFDLNLWRSHPCMIPLSSQFNAFQSMMLSAKNSSICPAPYFYFCSDNGNSTTYSPPPRFYIRAIPPPFSPTTLSTSHPADKRWPHSCGSPSNSVPISPLPALNRSPGVSFYQPTKTTPQRHVRCASPLWFLFPRIFAISTLLCP